MNKKIGLLAFLCLLFVGGSFFFFLNRGSSEEGVTKIAMNIELKGINVASTTLDSLRDERPVYLNFWAPWCAPCVEELPDIDAMYEKYGDQINFAAVAVHAEGQNLEKFVGDHGFSMPVYEGNAREIVTTYRLDAVPVSLLIASDGTIIAEHLGGMDSEELEKFLSQVL